MTPVVSDVSALLISGERDPVTPQSNGAKIVRTLKNGLHRLAGTYEDAASGQIARADIVGNRLRVTLDGTPALLVATSPTRFRVEGFSPEMSVVFQMAGGRATRMTIVNPGAPEQVMTRSPRP